MSDRSALWKAHLHFTHDRRKGSTRQLGEDCDVQKRGQDTRGRWGGSQKHSRRGSVGNGARAEQRAL